MIDAFVEAAYALVPDKKFSGKAYKLLKAAIIIFTVSTIVLFIAGICLLAESDGANNLGKVFVVFMPLEFIIVAILHIVRKVKKGHNIVITKFVTE